VTTIERDGEARPRRRPLKRTTKLGLAFILLLSLTEVAALGTRYHLTDRRWVIVDNAQVDGEQIAINAPADGVLKDWRVDLGTPVAPNQLVGFVEVSGNGVKVRRPIRSGGRGTVAHTDASVGEYVTTGTQLAVAYGDDGLHVTARVPEGEVGEVRAGAPVDILVDAAPDRPITGSVASVGSAAAGVDELRNEPGGDPTDLDQPVYPGPDTDPQNPQKVEQYVPVRIELDPARALEVRPGMNVTVHIHRPHDGQDTP
jgi:multidrug resistance efflux pump